MFGMPMLEKRKKFKFEPWNKVNKKAQNIILLHVFEPPCIHCHFWSPQAIFFPTLEGPMFDSVRLCWRDGSMLQDFSCYKEKE